MKFGNKLSFPCLFQSILRSVSIAGTIIGPAAGGLLYNAGGYPLPFYIIGVAAMVVAMLQAVFMPNLTRVSELSQQVIEDSDGHKSSDAVMADQKPAKKASIWKLFTNRHMTFSFFININIGFVLMFYNSSISLHVLPVSFYFQNFLYRCCAAHTAQVALVIGLRVFRLFGQLVGSVSRVGYVMLVTGLSDVLCGPFAGWLLDRLVTPECATVIYFCLSTTGLLIIGPSPFLPFFHKSVVKFCDQAHINMLDVTEFVQMFFLQIAAFGNMRHGLLGIRNSFWLPVAVQASP